jgi:ribosomal-protein-alanine N-acetyltransferase
MSPLRSMSVADLPEVMDLEHTLFPEDAWSEAMFRAELAAKPGSRHFVVADDAGAVAGYAGLITAGGEGDVVTIAVHPQRWGLGIGSALLTELIEEARRRGCRRLFLEVRADNPRARKLYERFGFVEVGVRKGYYPPSGVDAIVMRLEMAKSD